MTRACGACLRRAWLIQRVSGCIEFTRGDVAGLLGLGDEALIDLWSDVAARRGAGRELAREYEAFGSASARAARSRAQTAGLSLICSCDEAYPERLRRLQAPPAVLHVAGGAGRFAQLAAADPVAIVGTRRPTTYGAETAIMLGRGVSASGLTVVSGLAIGIDAAAHRGALAGGGHTIAVLPGCAAEPYPKTNRSLHGRILRAGGAVVSEFGPEAAVRRWTLIARNRIIAALAELTIVVQGGERSGSLHTARVAAEVGSLTGAVPGPVQAGQSDAPHALLRTGALLIRDAQDVLDAVFGAGVRVAAHPVTATLDREEHAVLEAIRAGTDTVAALSRAGVGGPGLLVALARLELLGCVCRGAGGRYRLTA